MRTQTGRHRACWRSNISGQIGDGTTAARLEPIIVPGLSGVTARSAGGNRTCVVKQHATAACWGDDAYGQLGDGSTTDKLIPTPINGL